MSAEDEQIFDQILTAFLDKWREEMRLIPERMADVDNMEWRNFLASYDPTLSKPIEGNPREVVGDGLVKLALAKAVTYAILTALRNYR